MSDAAIVVEGLVKRYGEVEALTGIDLTVPPATVLGLLGPNGAGKTTAVRILTTLLHPDAGRATVAGYDVVRQAEKLRHVIGLAGQNAAVDENLTGLENLEMVGRLYHVPAAEARRRGRELLERFELTGAADRVAKTYSGGMRRRLDLGASLVGQPAGAVPRRADDRARPPEPHRDVGHHPRAREGGHHPAAHHAVPRGGRPARGQDRRDRPRPRDRRRHRRRAEGPRGRRGARSPASPTASSRRRRRAWCSASARAAGTSTTTPARSTCRSDRTGPRSSPKRSGGWTPRASASRDVGLRRPTLDDVFLGLTGHAAEGGADGEASADGDRSSKRKRRRERERA